LLFPPTLYQTDPQHDYVVAIFIGVGIAMFMTSTDELSFDLDIYGEKTSAKWTGVMLLIFFLFFDSFTSQVCALCKRVNIVIHICTFLTLWQRNNGQPLHDSGKVGCLSDTVTYQ